LTATGIGEHDLRDVFKNAIASAEEDVNDPSVQSLLQFGSMVGAAAGAILKEFSEKAEDALSFMDEYSASVFITDENSRGYIKTLNTGLEQEDPHERHIAQYLLRTNVAIELATAQGQSGIPYHPHSHRTHYVVRKLESDRQRARFSANYLLRYVESEIGEHNQETYSNSEGIFGFPSFEDQAPLITTVLSGANGPEDITKRALEIRDSREAKNYRSFVAELLSTFETGDVVARRRATQNLADAKALLILELDKLYGKKRNSELTILAKLVGVASNEFVSGAFNEGHPTLATAKAAAKVAEVATQHAIETLRAVPAAVRTSGLRRRIAFLLTLAKQEGGRNDLNAMLKRSFHKEFSPAELAAFFDLRRERPFVK
jgi:hypothetical protein